jgi:hypothetical protein
MVVDFDAYTLKFIARMLDQIDTISKRGLCALMLDHVFMSDEDIATIDLSDVRLYMVERGFAWLGVNDPRVFAFIIWTDIGIQCLQAYCTEDRMDITIFIPTRKALIRNDLRFAQEGNTRERVANINTSAVWRFIDRFITNPNFRAPTA